MTPRHNIQDLLRGVSSFNELYAGVLKGQKKEFLCHPFWDIEEIRLAESLKDDWNVPALLTPFYGDWHDLFCINSEDHSVVEIDDSRNVTTRWKSFEEFKDALIPVDSWEDDSSDGNRDVVSGHLDF